MIDFFNVAANDFISFFISAALLGLYQAYLAYKVKKRPTYTVQAVNRIARTAWVETIMNERRDVLAVQTLRNSTMAATFLASTAVLLIIGVLNLSGEAEKLNTTWHALNAVGATNNSIWLIKLLVLLSDLFVAFFCFSMSIRLYNHVGFMINVPLTLNHKMISPPHVASHLNRAGKFYSIGMRAYYFSVPMVFWLFGPHFMVAATILLIFVLYFIDRAPKVMADDYAQ
ncbi:DUF599 domain-containing protein [Sulfuriferula nivalis]|nr:DUF599 domain-containing protein [Sulfuriferula nivalis]